MPQLHVRNVFHVNPTYAKLTLPLVLRPDTTVALIVDRRHHLRHAAEVARPVDGEKQIERRALAARLPISLIQPLVAVLRAAPDLVFNRPVYVVLRVGFDHEEPGPGSSLIELYGVVIIFHLQLVEYRMRRILCELLLLRLLLLLLLVLLLLLMMMMMMMVLLLLLMLRLRRHM